MKTRNFDRLRRETRGDVLMEYVLINLMVVLALAGAGGVLVKPAGATFTVEGTLVGEDFGLFGNAVVGAWRRITAGLSLPLP